jgi:biopolymer transport protein ExbB
MERMVFLARERGRSDQKALSSFMAAVDHGRFEEAVKIGESTKDFVIRTLGYALAHREKSLPSALMYANAREIKRFQRGLPILDTTITIAPLLGLLGTVTGMMSSFSLIGGELGAPGAITGGIAEALIATAFGLGIAIVALVPFNFLNNKTEQARHQLSEAAAHLELLAKPWLDALEVTNGAKHERAASPRVADPSPADAKAMVGSAA